jgi:tetratricopeptide (TPR) repeat protein
LQDTLKTAEQVQGEATPARIDTASVKLLLAQVYVETNSPDQALKLYDEVISTTPDDFRPVLAKALVLQEQGDTETAQSLFTQATALAPAQFKDQIQQMAAQSQAPAPLPLAPETSPQPDSNQPPASNQPE